MTKKKTSPSSKMRRTMRDLSLLGVPVIPSLMAVRVRTRKSRIVLRVVVITHPCSGTQLAVSKIPVQEEFCQLRTLAKTCHTRHAAATSAPG